MTNITHSPSAPPFPFSRFQYLHRGERPSCMYCGHGVVHRWGKFSGRQRYRCTACKRTFSDFTGTPLANLKRVDRWPAFCHCMLHSMTVRRTARLLGVDKTTAFRWRHRLLRALDASDTASLGATVVVHETSFPYSEKGKRKLDRPPRRRGAIGRIDHEIPRAWVFVARDELGRIASGVVGPRRPRTNDLLAALAPRLERTWEIVSTIGPYGAAGLLAVRTDRVYRRTQRRSSEFQPIDRSIQALRRWIRRFHGVATRYLNNYLAWHRLLQLGAGSAVGRPVRAITRFGDVAPEGTGQTERRDPGGSYHTPVPHNWLLAGHFP